MNDAGRSREGLCRSFGAGRGGSGIGSSRPPFRAVRDDECRVDRDERRGRAGGVIIGGFLGIEDIYSLFITGVSFPGVLNP